MFRIRRYRLSDYQAVWDLHNLALQQVAAQGLYEKNGYTATGKSRFDPFVVISYQKALGSQAHAKGV